MVYLKEGSRFGSEGVNQTTILYTHYNLSSAKFNLKHKHQQLNQSQKLIYTLVYTNEKKQKQLLH